MNVAILGAGYVGTPTAAVLAKFNPEIAFYVLDVNEDLIQKWNDRIYPFFEENLDQYIEATINKNLFFTTNSQMVYEECSIYYICVNTSTKTTGVGSKYATDMTSIINCVEEISKFYKDKGVQKELIVVEKSTVPLKTSDLIRKIVSRNFGLSESNLERLSIISNPEFLAEGEFTRPCYRRFSPPRSYCDRWKFRNRI
jgi:UDPglucose 6-dehydrogenase